MDPLILNRLELELTFFAVFVLFAVVALLVVARKATNTRQVVLSGDIPASNAVLDEIARTAQARIGTLPMAAPFHFRPAQKSPQAMVDVPGGPVIVNGSKYLLESSWTHLPTFEQGREGEERVVNSLVNSLGQGWYIFRNFVLPTKEDDIDVVLVGPGGIYAIEVREILSGTPTSSAADATSRPRKGSSTGKDAMLTARQTEPRFTSILSLNDHGLGAHSNV